jgi:hypothetical protein
MLTKNTYGVTLSNYFNNAINAPAQNVKPKITIDLLDSRHIDLNPILTGNVAITNTDAHTITSEGSIGFYFSEQQMINGYERQSFTWAVTDSLDKNGKIITADGSWHCMPTSVNKDNQLEGDFEFGWWSKTRSLANGSFSSSPVVTIAFQPRKVNKIRITTSEFYGQVKSFRIKVEGSTLIDLLDKTITLEDDEYYKDIYLKSDNAINADFIAARIELTVISTKNGNDYARIHEVSPIYEYDITDYVVDYNISRARDVHESNVPIGGSQSPKIVINLDNTNKDWNIFNNSSLFGKYMKKDLKINVSTGWRIKKTNAVTLQTKLRSTFSNVSTTMIVDDSSIFPEGGNNNNFIAIINPENDNREIVLCSHISGTNTISISQRGLLETDAVQHAVGSVVLFDPYEYVSMGTFYVDEWSSNSGDMKVTINASDWTKFLLEKQLENGFLVEDKTVGDAVLHLLMMRNFPRADYKQILPYSGGTRELGAVARYSFSEDSIDNNGNLTSIQPGLRVRLWGMRSGFESTYRTIKSDVLEKFISIEDRIRGVELYSAPDRVLLSTSVTGSENDALKLVNYTFSSNITSETFARYYNGVVDGYYIPSTTDNDQAIVLDINNGGARIYIDDLLVGKSTIESPSISIQTIPLNLQAGVPYKLRIEFFHGPGNANFSMSLHSYTYNPSTEQYVKTLLSKNNVRPIVARDGLGSRNLTSVVPSTYAINSIVENHHQNDAYLHPNTQLNYSTTYQSDPENRGVFLIDDAYVRIPSHSSIALTESDFSFEVIARFNQGGYSGDGEYLSSWSNSSPTSGFEFYHLSSGAHGFKIRTDVPSTEFVQSNTSLLTQDFYHIAVTYNSNSKILSYYLNGRLENEKQIVGNIVTNTSDITIGGRGASFTAAYNSFTENAPSAAREMSIDEFVLYKTSLKSEQVLDRYIASTVQYVPKFPFLYSEDQHLRAAIDNISLADLGRFYIDEENIARYEHYNRFYESSIDQHSNIQYTFSDITNIIDGTLNVQLQTNKVIVKVASVAKLSNRPESLWTAEDKTSLGSVRLTSMLMSSDTGMFVSTTTRPVFANTGYLAFSKLNANSVLQTEIVKYNSKSISSFLNLERGKFGTPILDEVPVDTHIREARYYEITYDKKPAVAVLSPISTGIIADEPDSLNILKFESTPYTAKLIISASANIGYDNHIYIQGEDPRSNIAYSTSIFGTPVIVTESSEKVTEQVESLSDSIRKYGLKEITIDSKYITSTDHAQRIAEFLIEKMADPVPIVAVNTMCVPKIQLGDKIRISSLDSLDIINNDYWVISQEISYSESLSQSLILRRVN